MVLNGETSNLLPVTSGVPQGSILAPLLFLLYVNGVNDVVLSRASKLILYADDIATLECSLYYTTTASNKYASTSTKTVYMK